MTALPWSACGTVSSLATASGRVLTAAQMNAHNDFAAPDAVKPAAFGDARIAGDTLTVTLPAKSVVMLDLQ